MLLTVYTTASSRHTARQTERTGAARRRGGGLAQLTTDASGHSQSSEAPLSTRALWRSGCQEAQRSSNCLSADLAGGLRAEAQRCEMLHGVPLRCPLPPAALPARCRLCRLPARLPVRRPPPPPAAAQAVNKSPSPSPARNLDSPCTAQGCRVPHRLWPARRRGQPWLAVALAAQEDPAGTGHLSIKTLPAQRRRRRHVNN